MQIHLSSHYQRSQNSLNIAKLGLENAQQKSSSCSDTTIDSALSGDSTIYLNNCLITEPLTFKDLIEETENRCSGNNKAESKRLDHRVIEFRYLEANEYKPIKIWGSHENSAYRKKGISQFDTLLLKKRGEFYLYKLGSSLFSQKIGLLESLEKNKMLDKNLKNIGIKWEYSPESVKKEIQTDILLSIKSSQFNFTFNSKVDDKPHSSDSINNQKEDSSKNPRKDLETELNVIIQSLLTPKFMSNNDIEMYYTKQSKNISTQHLLNHKTKKIYRDNQLIKHQNNIKKMFTENGTDDFLPHLPPRMNLNLRTLQLLRNSKDNNDKHEDSFAEKLRKRYNERNQQLAADENDKHSKEITKKVNKISSMKEEKKCNLKEVNTQLKNAKENNELPFLNNEKNEDLDYVTSLVLKNLINHNNDLKKEYKIKAEYNRKKVEELNQKLSDAKKESNKLNTIRDLNKTINDKLEKPHPPEPPIKEKKTLRKKLQSACISIKRFILK